MWSKFPIIRKNTGNLFSRRSTTRTRPWTKSGFRMKREIRSLKGERSNSAESRTCRFQKERSEITAARQNRRQIARTPLSLTKSGNFFPHSLAIENRFACHRCVTIQDSFCLRLSTFRFVCHFNGLKDRRRRRRLFGNRGGLGALRMRPSSSVLARRNSSKLTKEGTP